MQETIARGSARRIARRLGAAGLALAAVVTLGACKATGGGQIGDPLDSGVIARLHRRCKLRLQLHLRGGNGQEEDRDQGPDHLPRRPQRNHLVDEECRRLPGDQDPRHCGAHRFLGRHRVRDGGGEAVRGDPAAQPPFEGIPAALFEGTYRSQDTTVSSALPARPSSPFWWATRVSRLARAGSSPGTSSPSSSTGARTPLYTRGGYIEGGNIQVDNT